MFWNKKKEKTEDDLFTCECGCQLFVEVVDIDNKRFTPRNRIPACFMCGTIYRPNREVYLRKPK